MIKTDKNIYIQETEIKPNRYAITVLRVTLFGVIFSWVLNELGFFRVDTMQMRIGSIVPMICVGLPLTIIKFNKKLLASPNTKYFIMFCSIVFTSVTGILLTFHTTIMVLYPIFIAMLYRSKNVGIFGTCGSILCTILCPVISYLIGAWDVPLFQELILIATGGTAEIVNPTYTIETIAILKTLLYIVLPRLIMVGSCTILLFYIISLGAQHVENQIKLNQISHHDSLTNLYNQNYYKEIIESNELSGQIGVMFFDVNNLKETNDKNGHEYGDLLLQRCVQSIKDVLIENKDYAFRAGGDEFIILSEGADVNYIEDKIKKWKKALEKVNEQNKKDNNGLICSMAVGYEIGDFKDIASVANIADQKMYANKAKEKANKK